MYKVGDILICKRDFVSANFKIGNRYKITNKSVTYLFIDIVDTYSHISSSGTWFNFYDRSHFYYIKDYFYTEKEYRKQKLKQLVCIM